MTIKNDTIMVDIYFDDAIQLDHKIFVDHIRVRKEIQMPWGQDCGQAFYAKMVSSRYWDFSMEFPESTLYIIGESFIS